MTTAERLKMAADKFPSFILKDCPGIWLPFPPGAKARLRSFCLALGMEEAPVEAAVLPDGQIFTTILFESPRAVILMPPDSACVFTRQEFDDWMARCPVPKGDQ
jgi:hypothetical protein